MSPTNKHIWFLGDNFFFLTIPFISFSWVTALDSISSTLLSLIAESRYLSLVCNLGWRHSVFYYVSCVFFIHTLNPVLEFSSVPNLLRLLSWMGIWFLSNASSMFIYSVLFFFLLLLLVWILDCFSSVVHPCLSWSWCIIFLRVLLDLNY